MEEEISFGAWLHKQRRALDLTRQAFADQVGCAEVTLRRIESGTLKPSKELASLLLEKLGIPEIEHPQWISFARGLSGLPGQSSPSSKKPITNLPAPLTTFIGRAKEQSDVIGLITKHRLVTLAGSGGVGKTRLSLKAGEQVLENYADGVWFVEFAPILDPLLVSRTTAIAIGLRDEPQRPIIDMLSDYLREKNILVILDNCEHLLDACAQLSDTLLKNCPNLKILATSREALGILGEAVYPVPTLELPDFQQLLENFRHYESVRLFEERAQLTQMNFSLTMENASDIAKICTHLDGIPLAIELAAARINTFSTRQIEMRLQESFSFLTTGNRTALPRHQTLQAAIDWSYDLLLPAEKQIFRRLSVFVNGWTIEAAQSICPDSNIMVEDISDILAQLTNKSLVVVKELPGGLRYHMLETIRQYANEKMVESGEGDELRDRHLDYFLNLAETVEPYLTRPEQLEWLPLLDANYENLRLALEWALSKESAEPSLTLCRALWWFWIIRCYWLEGLNWVQRSLAKPSRNESKAEKVTRARVLSIRSDFENLSGKGIEQTLASAEAGLALALEVSDKKDIAIARYLLGNALSMSGENDDQACSLIEQSFAEFQELNEPFRQVDCYIHLGPLLWKQGKISSRDRMLRWLELARTAGERLLLADALSAYARWLFRINGTEEAMLYAEESELLYKLIGAENHSWNLQLFAEIAWGNEDYYTARSLYLKLKELSKVIGHKSVTAFCTTTLGLLAMEEGQLQRSQEYLEQALAMMQELGYKPSIASSLVDLSNLYYRQDNLAAFKQNFRETLSFSLDLHERDKALVLAGILGSLYLQKPESSARLMGVIINSEREHDYKLTLIEKRYWNRAEIYTRGLLGDRVFESAFEKGQQMSLDEGLDLALKTMEQM